jgi:hypothetical protein
MSKGKGMVYSLGWVAYGLRVSAEPNIEEGRGWCHISHNMFTVPIPKAPAMLAQPFAFR